MNANTPSAVADLLLVCETDPDSIATLRRVADRLGCDLVETADANELNTVLCMRHPTIVVLAVDGADSDSLERLSVLTQHDSRPATLLVGNQDERGLAAVKRIAVARGLPVIAARQRPLTEGEFEQLLLDHVMAPLAISRAELEQALGEHEFLLQYQPKVSLAMNQMDVIGVEALVRWRHPRRGTLLPRHFLGAVEQHGMLIPLADLVITEAIRQAGVWNERGICLPIAINLSPGLVQDRAFPERLAALLREQDVPPAQITLDVTEMAGAQDRDLLHDVFTRLRAMGLGLSLDNFGAGMSSLTELYRTPYSEIKIDRRFLEDAIHERDAELVVRAMVEVAHELRLKVCAEGVETEHALAFIRSARFDCAQGHLFSEPVAPSRIEEMLAGLGRSRSVGLGAWRALRDLDELPEQDAGPEGPDGDAVQARVRSGDR